ncbi:MAG: phosphatidylglycerophosphatase A [Chlamydiae bacterium]|nr:MAG: phosphatidylglycerophosphatase A [Chlamydiota bacterium]
MKQKISKFIATFGGIGLFPFAPGSVGSIAGLIILGAISFAPSAAYQIILQILFLLIFIPLGVIASSAYEKYFRKIDPKEVVIDEVVGMVITLFALPFSLFNVIAGYLLFRFLDIVKPFPIGKLQNIKGGWGIMADDIAAGIVSAVILRLLIFFIVS